MKKNIGLIISLTLFVGGIVMPLSASAAQATQVEYKNETFGYSIRYPKSLKLDKKNEKEVIVGTVSSKPGVGSLKVIIEENKSLPSIADAQNRPSLYSRFAGTNGNKCKNSVLAKQKALRCEEDPFFGDEEFSGPAGALADDTGREITYLMQLGKNLLIFSYVDKNDVGMEKIIKSVKLIPVKQKMSTYNASGVKFAYPASWGTLSDRSAEIIKNSDGQKAFESAYLKTMLPLSASNSLIKEVFFHKPTKIVAYVESRGKNDVLSIMKDNGSVVKVASQGNDINNAETCGYFGDVNISPRGYLLFVEESGCVEGGLTQIYDLRTLKKITFTEDSIIQFSPQHDIFFSKDASRMAIRTQGSDVTGAEESLYIQDTKTLNMKAVYSIHIDEYDVARKKYGEDAMVKLADIVFDAKGNLSFVKVVSRDVEGKKRAEVERSTYAFSGKGKLNTSKVQILK